MAEKVSEKKKKCGSSNKEGRLTKSWPDLPPQLVNFIQKDSTIMQNMSFQGVSKSWRSAPRQCNHNPSLHPWLSISQSNGHHDQKQHWQTTPFTNHFFWDPRKQHQNLSHHLVGSTNGLLIAKASHNSLQYCVWDPVKSLKLDLPQWDANVPFKLMVLTGMSHPTFLFYKIQGGNEYAWVKQDCTITDPQHHWDKSERRRYMQFTNAIGFEGKFYALSLQGTLAVIEVTDPYPQITAVSTTRAVPSIFLRHFQEYLVETGGEILLVFLISNKSSTDVVDSVEVFRLHIGKLSWVKIESLGDRALFVGVNCCMVVSISKIGFRSDCLYVTHFSSNGWLVYDMKRGQISPCDQYVLNQQSQ
ncbi:hypothetical protein PRUPE_8G073600 [Prunus persica]|uniref:KIB1-4 beta-propeller domain-containing protein n=1 Tax=Prunus persica TaxID=3760 RepID=A0A251MUM7_PRUPE|nr:hypothetical protein PRUPE_8G073600 [Prunus persica]